VLWPILDTENNPHHRDLLDMSVLHPGGATGPTAMPWTLSDGSVYTGDAWPLLDDATLIPAEILAAGTRATSPCGGDRSLSAPSISRRYLRIRLDRQDPAAPDRIAHRTDRACNRLLRVDALRKMLSPAFRDSPEP
jgi:hypothetical protein